MRKFVLSISMGAIFIALVMFSIYSQYQLDRVPVEYSYDIETEDFYLKDINFVAYHNSLYVTGNYYLEMIGDNKQFEGISFEFSLDGTSLMSLAHAQSDNPFTLPDAMDGRRYYNHGGLLENIKVRNNDIIKVEIHYKVNGKSKEVVGEIKLSDVIKPFSSTGGREPIRL